MALFEQLSRDGCCLLRATSENVLERASFLALRGRSAERQQQPRPQRRSHMMLISSGFMKPSSVPRHQPGYV
jgi:hypothetical protein